MVVSFCGCFGAGCESVFLLKVRVMLWSDTVLQEKFHPHLSQLILEI